MGKLENASEQILSLEGMDHNKIITFFIQKCPWTLAYMLRKKKYFNLKTEGKFFKLLLLFVKKEISRQIWSTSHFSI